MSNRYIEMGLRAPVNVTWEVTYACNLSCIHCLSDSGRKRSQELTTCQCLRVIDALSANKVFQFSIGGGEPFSRSDFLDLMDYAHEKGMLTCISTNGTLITDAVAARLNHKLVYIQVSLDGATAASNDAVRGTGSFRRALKAIESLRKRDVEVSINTVLTRLSLPDLDALAGLAGSLGAKFRVSRFRPSGRGKASWSTLSVSKREMLSFSDWLSSHQSVSTGDSFFSVAHEDRRHLGLNMCGACKLTCCISPEGNVYPCAFLQEDEFCAGTLPDAAFSSIWNASPVFHAFRALEIKSCEHCNRFEMCHGGCPAIAYHTQKKLGFPDPGCLVNCVSEKSFVSGSAG
ncbi:MAG: mycofactocin radical SAM maturase [Thermodesulfobacteriota bacterium]